MSCERSDERSPSLEQLVQLIGGFVKNEDPECRVSPDVAAKATELFQGSSLPLHELLLGDPYPDGNGSLRCEWRIKNREMRLVLYPKIPSSYIYYEEKLGTEHSRGIIHPVTPETFSERFMWLVAGR